MPDREPQPQPRKLHITWVNAGQRRTITRALHNAGFTHKAIAELLDVSQTTISKDLRA